MTRKTDCPTCGERIPVMSKKTFTKKFGTGGGRFPRHILIRGRDPVTVSCPNWKKVEYDLERGRQMAREIIAGRKTFDEGLIELLRG